MRLRSFRKVRFFYVTLFPKFVSKRFYSPKEKRKSKRKSKTDAEGVESADFRRFPAIPNRLRVNGVQHKRAEPAAWPTKSKNRKNDRPRRCSDLKRDLQNTNTSSFFQLPICKIGPEIARHTAGARRPHHGMASSRRAGRTAVGASSGVSGVGTAAGADLEALVRELLELDRHTERNERMLSRTQARQRERHEREQREQRERREAVDVAAAHQVREAAVARERRLGRLERREARRDEARWARVETRETRARDQNQHQNQHQHQTDARVARGSSPRRSPPSGGFESRGRGDRVGRPERDIDRRDGGRGDGGRGDSGGRDARRRRRDARDRSADNRHAADAEDVSANETLNSNRAFVWDSVSVSENDTHDDNARRVSVTALANEIARLRRRLGRLSRETTTQPQPTPFRAPRWTTRSAPRLRRDAWDGYDGYDGYAGYDRYGSAQHEHATHGARTAPRPRHAPPETHRFRDWDEPQGDHGGWRNNHRDRGVSFDTSDQEDARDHGRYGTGYDRQGPAAGWAGDSGHDGGFAETAARRRDPRRAAPRSPTLSVRPDSAIDWETGGEQHLRDGRDAYRDGGSVPGLGRFFDELQELRSRITDRDARFFSRNTDGGRSGQRPNGPWRDPRLGSPLHSRSQGGRNAGDGGDGGDGTNGRGDDTADERGASPTEAFPRPLDDGSSLNHEHDIEPSWNVAREPRGSGNRSGARRGNLAAGPENGRTPVRETVETQTRPVSARPDWLDRPDHAGPSGHGADAELGGLLRERPGFSEMLAGVLARFRALPVADFREACVGFMANSESRGASGVPPVSGYGAQRNEAEESRPAGVNVVFGSPLGGDDTRSATSNSDSEFAYVRYEPPAANRREPLGLSAGGGFQELGINLPAYVPPVPAGAPWRGEDEGSLLLDLETPDRVGEVTFLDMFGEESLLDLGLASLRDPPARTEVPQSAPTNTEVASRVERRVLVAANIPNTTGSFQSFGNNQGVGYLPSHSGEIHPAPPPPPPATASTPAPRVGDATRQIQTGYGGFDEPVLHRQSFGSRSSSESRFEIALDADAMARMLKDEHDAQRVSEMAPFLDGTEIRDAERDLDEYAAPPRDFAESPANLAEAASRLPFSSSLNTTLMDALGSVVAWTGNDAHGPVVEEKKEKKEKEAEKYSFTPEPVDSIEARKRAEARAAAAAAEIASARQATREAVQAREAGEARQAAADTNANATANAGSGSSPPRAPADSAATSSTPKKSPASSKLLTFKERLALFNAPTPG